MSSNVNGIRAAARRGGIERLAELEPQVLTLQEVRGSDQHLVAAIADTPFEDWHVAYASCATPGRNGVAILTPATPLAIRHGLPEFAPEGRWLEVDLPSREHGVITVVSAYVFTGLADSPRQEEKYRFMDAMSQRLDELARRAAQDGGEALITGDLNVAHRDLDIKNWKGNLKKAGFLAAERAYFDRWLGYGWDGTTPSSGPVPHEGPWIDLGRKHGGDGPGPYTWWSWRGKAFDNDAGWRIDYQLATRRLAARSLSAVVGRAPSYAERWSDHAPLIVTFA
ncbi:exodeoxyribonuclease III [Blastococcus sp. Marseille-P5729]|uniref:exodeoxyribonuclease III n=1 Tax=Blastococcus sp. Marseille-P5729 TaxID=2086582 RepID=UPI001F2A977D|nr:exodeoxyribonuclease III [Blastococcus sp. Marseille-P5729]